MATGVAPPADPAGGWELRFATTDAVKGWDALFDVLPGLKSGDSRWRLTPLLGCFLLQHPLPQRVAVLHGLHSRLVSLPARQRE